MEMDLSKLSLIMIVNRDSAWVVQMTNFNRYKYIVVR